MTNNLPGFPALPRKMLLDSTIKSLVELLEALKDAPPVDDEEVVIATDKSGQPIKAHIREQELIVTYRGRRYTLRIEILH